MERKILEEMKYQYPYHLGCHLKTGRLCRIPHPNLGFGIPQGFARVIWYREKKHVYFKYNPYTEDGELDIRYWSIVRWSDIQRELGEEVTGPLIAALMTKPYGW